MLSFTFKNTTLGFLYFSLHFGIYTDIKYGSRCIHMSISYLISIYQIKLDLWILCLIPCSGNSQSAGSGGGHTEHRLAARLRPQELDWYASFSPVCLTMKLDMTL